jgi:hypothetical protein
MKAMPSSSDWLPPPSISFSGTAYSDVEKAFGVPKLPNSPARAERLLKKQSTYKVHVAGVLDPGEICRNKVVTLSVGRHGPRQRIRRGPGMF